MIPRSSWAFTATAAAATCTAAAGLAALAIAHARGTPLYHHARRGPPVRGHAESFGAVAVSPQGQALRRGDSYSTTIPLARLRPGITDREILARFTAGFYGGPVFAPEKYFFALSGYQVTDVDAIKKAAVIHALPDSNDDLTITTIRDSSSLKSNTVPTAGSLLFGNFLLLDSHFRAQPLRESRSPPVPAGEGATASYIDFVFGGGQHSPISGSHRFQVTRRADQEAVDITFSSVTDLAHGGLYSHCLFAFHTLYSHLLFSDAIRRVLDAKA